MSEQPETVLERIVALAWDASRWRGRLRDGERLRAYVDRTDLYDGYRVNIYRPDPPPGYHEGCYFLVDGRKFHALSRSRESLVNFVVEQVEIALDKFLACPLPKFRIRRRDARWGRA